MKVILADLKVEELQQMSDDVKNYRQEILVYIAEVDEKRRELEVGKNEAANDFGLIIQEICRREAVQNDTNK